MSQYDKFLEKQGVQVHSAQGRKFASIPTGPRAIDREAGVRTRPMKVILASMSRTGTFSMYTAFQKLGMSPYHMAEALKMPTRDIKIAFEALNASRLGEGKPFEREEFDKWIGDFDAVCDAPMCFLVNELIQAYPEAKVVLTTRDPAKWRKSMENTVLTIQGWRTWSILGLFSADCKSYNKFLAICTKIMDNWSTEALVRHSEQVRQVVPKNRLLEFRLGHDGWEKLCEFLDVPVPEGDFPNTNDSGMFVTIHAILINVWALKALRNAAVQLAPVGVLVGAIWWVKKQGLF